MSDLLILKQVTDTIDWVRGTMSDVHLPVSGERQIKQRERFDREAHAAHTCLLAAECSGDPNELVAAKRRVRDVADRRRRHNSKAAWRVSLCFRVSVMMAVISVALFALSMLLLTGRGHGAEVPDGVIARIALAAGAVGWLAHIVGEAGLFEWNRRQPKDCARPNGGRPSRPAGGSPE